MRNVLERASARETTMRVALGTLARKFLGELGVEIASRVTRIGSVEDPTSLHTIPDFSKMIYLNQRADASPVRCLNDAISAQMVAEIDLAKKEGDTLGGEIEILATGIPIGLGSYAQWDRRLEGQIAQSMMSLNAIKGVEIGLGFKTARLPGSKVHDEIFPAENGSVRYGSNHSGGIDGGVSNGQPLIVRAAMKPLATLMRPLHSVNLQTGEAADAHRERSDVCAVPAAAVIGESLLALVLTGAILEKFGGDSMKEIEARVKAWP